MHLSRYQFHFLSKNKFNATVYKKRWDSSHPVKKSLFLSFSGRVLGVFAAFVD